MRLHLAVLALPVWVLGCQPAADHGAAERAVMDADRRFARSVADHDMEAFRASIHPDAAFFGSRLLRGPDEIAEAWAPIVRGDVELTWEPEEAHVAASRDMAYTLGRAVFRSAGPAGEVDVSEVRYVTVWRTDRDGRWKAAADAGTVPAP